MHATVLWQQQMNLLLNDTSSNTFCQFTPSFHNHRTGSRVVLTINFSDININIDECVMLFFIYWNPNGSLAQMESLKKKENTQQDQIHDKDTDGLLQVS
jgi:hypothetical protein